MNVGIEVNRVNDDNFILVSLCQAFESQANIQNGLTEVFPAVCSHQHQAALSSGHAGLVKQLIHLRRGWLLADDLQGVNDRVAGDFDDLIRDALSQEVLAIVFCWGKVQVCHHTSDAAVHLFGEGLPFIVGSQPGFNVTHPDLAIIPENRCCHDRRGIPLDQQPIGTDLKQHRVQMGEDASGQLGKCLVVIHQIQVDIRDDVKCLQDLVEHFAVLGSDAHRDINVIWMFPQGFNHRRHFNSFRAGAKYRHNL
ncbi:MAG: hypothetical protein BWX85_00767 [Chloroflexi bacterium ADurb.Bin120]|nr:MAG: hypothetical protein BWX85_00767 [Chloroflexi bacterium ADurb.Bin120]